MAKKNKRQQDIKTKLMAAICMLLVSSIMMVSSTYAWFTLSTAPEVTGINTTVGSNGSLEMALLPLSGLVDDITSSAGDSMVSQTVDKANVTWGNLVDVSSNEIYGLNQITLYPAELNATYDTDGVTPLTIGTTLLKTPTYGPDGRIDTLTPNTSAYVLNQAKGSFLPSFDANAAEIQEYGVRAVGTASGMTDRQLAYRNARSTAATAMSAAKTKAAQSLNQNGPKLADIAVKKAAGGNQTYSYTDVSNLMKIVTDLESADGSLTQIENAYKYYLIAYAASGTSGLTDVQVSTVQGTLEASTDLLQTLEDLDAEFNVLSSLGDATQPLEALAETQEKVASAKAKLQALLDKGEDAEHTWTELSDAMYDLVNMDAMEVNGIAVKDVNGYKENESGNYKLVDGTYVQIADGEVYEGTKYSKNMDTLVGEVAGGGGIKVTMKSGGGVYADIADHCGDYSASVTVENLTVKGITIAKITAVMNADSDLPAAYLGILANTVLTAGAPASAGGQEMPLSDFYGYVIDLAFRTNAATSKLCIQSDAVDRIYEGNQNGVADSDNENLTTMGHGSSMIFNSVSATFGEEQIKGLMDGVRIVFFTIGANSNEVIATAKLDAQNAVLTENGWEAKIVLYTMVEDAAKTRYFEDDTNGTYELTVSYEEITDLENFTGTKYEQNADDTSKYDAVTGDPVDGTTYYQQVKSYTEIPEADLATFAGTKYSKLPGYSMQVSATNDDGNYEIMDLTQNVAHQVSVLVYLDGNAIDNGDVASDAANSLTGVMNLQFASNVDLEPMRYTALTEQNGAAEESSSSDASSESSDVAGG